MLRLCTWRAAAKRLGGAHWASNLRTVRSRRHIAGGAVAPPRASVGGGTSRARLEARAEDVTRPGNWRAGARDGRSGGKDAAGVYVNIVRRVARGRSRVEQGKRGRTAVGERTGTGQAASPRGAGGGHWLACGEAEEAGTWKGRWRRAPCLGWRPFRDKAGTGGEGRANRRGWRMGRARCGGPCRSENTRITWVGRSIFVRGVRNAHRRGGIPCRSSRVSSQRLRLAIGPVPATASLHARLITSPLFSRFLSFPTPRIRLPRSTLSVSRSASLSSPPTPTPCPTRPPPPVADGGSRAASSARPPSPQSSALSQVHVPPAGPPRLSSAIADRPSAAVAGRPLRSARTTSSRRSMSPMSGIAPRPR